MEQMFHLVKDEMFYSTRPSLIEKNNSFFNSWNICTITLINIHYLYTSTDKLSYLQATLGFAQELRSSLRLLLLKTFGALCGLDAEALSNLLVSVLPVELARDMQTDTQNIQKLTFSALVCAMLLSSGEPIPYTHYGELTPSSKSTCHMQSFFLSLSFFFKLITCRHYVLQLVVCIKFSIITKKLKRRRSTSKSSLYYIVTFFPSWIIIHEGHLNRL